MQLPSIVVFGEALTDIVQGPPGHWRSFPGGAPWNVARGLSQLGISCGFAGAVSSEALGEEIIQASISAGLHMDFIQRVDFDPLVAIVPSKHPPHYFFSGNADLHFNPDLLPVGWLDGVTACHFSCISLAREPLGSLLVAIARRAKAAGKRISFDPNWRNLMDDRYRQQVFEAMVAIADDIKLSDEDLRHLYPGLSDTRALGEIRRLNPDACLLFTRGERGLTLICAEGQFEQPAIAVHVADTVGAGDSCMAGWLASARLFPGDYRKRLLYSAACAAVSCSHEGAYAPRSEDVDQLISRAAGAACH